MKKTRLILLIGLAILLLALNAGRRAPATGEPAAPETISPEPLPESPWHSRPLAGYASPLSVFNLEDYQFAVGSNQAVFLYFYANWCPACRAEAQTALYPAFNEIQSDGLIGFRVNYGDDQTSSAERALARQFGVKVPNTKILLREGQVTLQDSAVWDKKRYLLELGN